MNVRRLLTAVALLTCLVPPRASAEWVVNDRSRCVHVWTAASMLDGPTAMLDAPLVPIRFVIGGVVQAAECPDVECGTAKKIALGTGGVMLALVFGPFTAFMDAVLGFTETITFGAAGWTLEDPTRLSLQPIRFVLVGDVCCFFSRPQDLTIDRCGRTVMHIPPERRWWEPPWWRRF